MVRGRHLLLSLAVLSSLGVDNVLGGPFRRQNGTVGSVHSVQNGSSSFSTPTQADTRVSSVSLPHPTATTTTTTIATTVAVAFSDSAGRPGEADATWRGLGPEAVSSSRTLLPSSTGDEYVYSRVYGVGGSMSTDSSGSARTAVPTGNSILPNPTTDRRPPPAQTQPSQTRAPLTQPDAPIPNTGGDGGNTYGPATTAAQATRPPPRPVPPGGGPPRLITTEVLEQSTESVDLGYNPTRPGQHGPLTQTTFQTSTRYLNETWSFNPSAASVSVCQASDLTAAPTSWSIVYTSTITWYGNPEDYRPPYPPISVPSPTATPNCVTTTEHSYGFAIPTSTKNTIVFLTTDKNPAVVYSTIHTPDYGVSQEPETRDNHISPTGGGAITTPPYNSQNPGGGQKPVTVVVQPTAVVINGNTIRDHSATKTQVVVVAGQTFTIDPTRVVGAGATVDRQSATGGGVFVPTPTSTSLAGIPVTVSSSLAIIGRTTFTLGPIPTTATVSGQTVTIGPAAVAISSQILSLPSIPSLTEVVVAGGELVTAIGRSVIVIHGTTLTYSLANAPPTTVITTLDDDTITLGPGGATVVTAGGTLTILGDGGGGGGTTTTQLAIVGGATLTKIGASVVVLRNVTYTIGPDPGSGSGSGGRTVTTVVGGETVTIAPTAVVIGSSISWGCPFGATTVITPPPGSGPTPGAGVGGVGAASATGGGGDGDDGDGDDREEEEEDAAWGGRPGWSRVVIGVCVALGVAGLI
ncbi:hypothetical protein VTK56DRAFT_255 [Thermocarpiscus australiensis]